jgi:hypothetical protein
MWGIAVVLSFAAFLLCKLHRFAGVSVMAFAGFPIWQFTSDLQDTDFGAAILSELGPDYVAHTYVATLVPVVVVAVSLIRRWR